MHMQKNIWHAKTNKKVHVEHNPYGTFGDIQIWCSQQLHPTEY